MADRPLGAVIVTPNISAAAGPASAAATTTDAAGNAAPSSELFRATLGGLLPKAAPASASRLAPAPVPSTSGGKQTLPDKIAARLASGATHAQIVESLAAELAAKIDGELGITSAHARRQLETVFATALAPPGGSAGGGSIADRARLLAGRLSRLEKVAHDVAAATGCEVAVSAGGEVGQQQYSAGSFLDAAPAKDDPAHHPSAAGPAAGALRPAAEVSAVERVLREAAALLAARLPAIESVAQQSTAPTHAPAQAAVSAPDPGPATSPVAASPVAAAQVAAGVLVERGTALAASRPGDGRTVNLGSKPAIATGGDTTLGRVLTRAALAADARPAPPVAPVSAASGEVHPQTEGDGEGRTVAARGEATLAVFLKSLTSALATEPTVPAPPVSSHPAAPVAAAPEPLLPTTVPAAAAAPFAIERSAPPSTGTSAIPPDPIDHSQIADQVLRGAFMRNVGQSSEMRLSLVPETLGDVSVKLIVNDGSVTAHVVAETSEVRDALVAAQPQLTKSLADAGLKLTAFTVDVSNDGAGFSQQGRQEAPPDRSARRFSRFGDIAIDDAVDDSRLEAIPSFGPSGAARRVAGDYSYFA